MEKIVDFCVQQRRELIRKKGICKDFVVRGKGLVLYSYIMYCSEYLEHLTYLVNNDLR